MRLDPGEHCVHSLVVRLHCLFPHLLAAEGVQDRYRLRCRKRGVKATHRTLPIAATQLQVGRRVTSRHHPQEAFSIHLTVEAEQTSTLAPPTARWLVTVQVVGGKPLRVIPPGFRSFQGGNPNRHPTPRSSREGQLCTRLSEMGRTRRWVLVIRIPSSVVHRVAGLASLGPIALLRGMGCCRSHRHLRGRHCHRRHRGRRVSERSRENTRVKPLQTPLQRLWRPPAREIQPQNGGGETPGRHSFPRLIRDSSRDCSETSRETVARSVAQAPTMNSRTWRSRPATSGVRDEMRRHAAIRALHSVSRVSKTLSDECHHRPTPAVHPNNTEMTGCPP